MRKAKMTFCLVLHTCIILCLFTRNSSGNILQKRGDPAADSGEKNHDREAEIEIPRKVLADILYKDHIFQDIFLEHLAPLKLQFGHVCENPNEWEQRFEQKDFDTNRHQGKIKWGDRNGHYGEQYWDLNH